MTERFTFTDGGLLVDLPPEERSLLAQITHLLAEVDGDPEDPGHRRLNVPVYLDNPNANSEWQHWAGAELETSRGHDRSVFSRVIDSTEPVVVDEDEANSLLRTLNEGRLAFAARLGVEVASDHDSLPDMERAALDYLGWVLEDLTLALMSRL